VSTKLFSLVLDIGGPLGIPVAQTPDALLSALSPIFAPRRIWLLANGNEEIELFRESTERFGEQTLWAGERLDAGDVLTHVDPADVGLLQDLRDALANRALDTVVMSAEGAMRFRAPMASEPNWYGRWRLGQPKCLLDLLSVRFQWDDDAKLFELSLSLSGFPLTSSRLLADGALDVGDEATAAANRELFFPTLAQLPSALQTPAGATRWSDDGDYAPLFRRDAEEIRNRWLEFMNARANQP
jgi:hypothetical protein